MGRINLKPKYEDFSLEANEKDLLRDTSSCALSDRFLRRWRSSHNLNQLRDSSFSSCTLQIKDLKDPLSTKFALWPSRQAKLKIFWIRPTNRFHASRIVFPFLLQLFSNWLLWGQNTCWLLNFLPLVVLKNQFF